MATQINQTRRCVLIAGAPCADVPFIRQTVRGDDYVICADRGYAVAQAAGVVPDLLVGDFDSYTGALPAAVERLTLPVEKDFSDTLHAAEAGLQRGMRRFVLLNATGGRLDHTLANLSVLEWLQNRGAEGRILSATEDVRLLPVGAHAFDGCTGLTFSVFPFGCEAVTLSYRGAKYPLQSGALHHGSAMGLSNIFTADTACITVERGQALVVLNRGAV